MFKIELCSLSTYETIKIILGDNEHYADLYYYCLDNSFFEKDQTFSKGFLNFACMMENWKLKIRSLSINSSDVLPFDFSDQYIGFILISRINEKDINVQYAITTNYEGWAISPSQLYLKNIIDKPYELPYKKYKMSIDQLLYCLENSLMNILSNLYSNAPVLSSLAKDQ